MNDYRKEFRSVSKEAWWTLPRVMLLLIVTCTILAGLGFGLRSLGVFGATVVERKVFENSYQRSESLKAEIAMNRATLAEIEAKLSNPRLDPDTRSDLEAQQTALRVRISAAERRQR